MAEMLLVSAGILVLALGAGWVVGKVRSVGALRRQGLVNHRGLNYNPERSMDRRDRREP